MAAGTEVVWENDGRNDHNVLPGRRATTGEWRPTTSRRATSYSYRFTEPGTYDYYCSLHGTTTAGMVGTIVVTG